VLWRQHLEAILAEYVDHYNRARPHRGLQLTPPSSTRAPDTAAAIRRRDVLGGLIREYELAA
jgi:transposase InsO family protein